VEDLLLEQELLFVVEHGSDGSSSPIRSTQSMIVTTLKTSTERGPCSEARWRDAILTRGRATRSVGRPASRDRSIASYGNRTGGLR
jgi:hypothetical protein